MTNSIKSNKGRVPGQSWESRFISPVRELQQQEDIRTEEVEAQPFILHNQGAELIQHKLDICQFLRVPSGIKVFCFGDSDSQACVRVRCTSIGLTLIYSGQPGSVGHMGVSVRE